MTRRLEGKWALVTGAGRGIGRAIALALAKEGARLALVARTQAQLDKVADEARAEGSPYVLVAAADLADSEQVDQVLKAVLSETGKKLSVLVNNAGIMSPGNAVEGEPADWERMFAVNVHAPMRLTREIAPYMVAARGGTIINIGSVAGVEAMSGSGAYAATKFALRGWSLSCYEKLRRDNIKVCLINPAFVHTQLVARISGVIPEHMLSTDDIAEAAMLAIRTSAACCPQEITLRLTRSALSG